MESYKCRACGRGSILSAEGSRSIYKRGRTKRGVVHFPGGFPRRRVSFSSFSELTTTPVNATRRAQPATMIQSTRKLHTASLTALTTSLLSLVFHSATMRLAISLNKAQARAATQLFSSCTTYPHTNVHINTHTRRTSAKDESLDCDNFLVGCPPLLRHGAGLCQRD